MKRHSLPPGARALVAFIGTVVLAVLAAVSLLMPDVAVQSVTRCRTGSRGWIRSCPPAFWTTERRSEPASLALRCSVCGSKELHSSKKHSIGVPFGDAHR